jgi:MFS superfamily sulfate permease-like transporter
LLGLLISIFIILKGNLKKAYSFDKEELHDGDKIIIKLAQEVSFLNKAAIKESLQELPENTKVTIDATDTVYIDHDVIELIEEFCKFTSIEKNITVKLKGFDEQYNLAHHESLKHITIKHKS